MAPTNIYGQEMVSIYLIKIKITTKFFKSSLPIIDEFLPSVLSVSPGSDSTDALVLRQLAPECVQTREITLESEHWYFIKYLQNKTLLSGQYGNL